MSALLLAAAAAQAQGVEGFAELRLQGYIGVDGDVPLLVVERLRPSFSAPLTDRIGLFTTVEAGMGQGWTPSGALSDLVEQEGLSAALLAAVRPPRTAAPARRAGPGPTAFDENPPKDENAAKAVRERAAGRR